MSKRSWLCLSLLVLAGAVTAAAVPPDRLTLKQVIQLALENSGQLAAARVQADVAQRQTRVNRSVFRPNIFTGSGAAYTNGFPSTPGGSGPSVFNLSYVQTIFNPPAKGKVRAAEDRTRAQRIAVDGVRDEVILRVASDYLELTEVRHSLELLRKERESAQKVLDVTKERVTAGVELPIDETQAELTRAKIEQRAISLEGREEVLEEDLRNATGLPPSNPLDFADAKLPPATDLPTEQLITLALRHSPGLRQAEMERQARMDELKGERGGYWPTVDLVGQYMVLSRINNYDQFYRDFQRNNLNVGVQVQIPIFRSRTSAAIALADSQYQESKLDLGNRRHALELQVRREARENREQEAGREVSRLELKLAQEKLAMVQAQYDQGHATLAAVEQARLDESEKWLNFLQTNFNGQKAQLELMKTTGQLAQLLR
jgi:outer membrane protein